MPAPPPLVDSLGIGVPGNRSFGWRRRPGGGRVEGGWLAGARGLHQVRVMGSLHGCPFAAKSAGPGDGRPYLSAERHLVVRRVCC